MRFRGCYLAVLVMLLGGCGSTSGDQSSQLAPAPSPQVLKIGLIAPLKAGLTAFGLGMRNSAQLALNQANANQVLPGYQLSLLAQDDSSDPTLGAPDAQIMVTDPNVIAVVGTYNSGVAATALPVLSQAGLALVSPANTDPTLTMGPNPSQPQRPYSTYFRLVIPDSIQGPQLAQYAYQTLRTRRVAVVTETKAVSQGLADDFQTAFTSMGGTVVFHQVVPDGTKDYTATMASLAPTQPQLIFFGGEYPSGAAARDAATAAGLTVPLMGGDGLKDQSYITQAGPASEGDYASSVGAPPDRQPGGPAFLAAYQQAGFADPPSDYGPYAYDATNLILQVARQLLAQGQLSRARLVGGLQAATATGVTGPIAFDSFGDTTHKVLTIYKVAGGVFAPQQVIQVP